MRARVLVTAASTLAFAVILAGQGPPPPQPGQGPTFRAGVDAVNVDAIVTDKQGRPVTDLTKDDFEIVENKKLQSIQSFKLIQIDDTQTASSFVHDISSLDEMQREAARDDRRVLVIFLDDYHVRVGNSLVIRQDLAKFISQLTPNDLVAVMYPLTSVNALTFTRNHDDTASSVMRFLGRKYNYIPTNPYEQNYAEYPPEAQELLRRQIVITALRALAAYLGTLKEGKKQVLYVSEGINGTLPPGIRTTGVTSTNMQSRPQSTQTERFFNQAEVLSEMTMLFAAAARSNTAFYTIDPRGLAVNDSTMADNLSSEEDRQLLNEAQDSLRILASNTDGKAIVNRNQPAADPVLLAKYLV
jgi:VWFA-related protein